MPRPSHPRLITTRRRLLAAFGAAVLLWAGPGTPDHARPVYHAERIALDGLELRAVRAGKGDTTLLFLHGYGESLLTWRFLLDRLPRHYRVLAVDLPGFGVSGKPRVHYDFSTYERWLEDLLDRETHGPVVVVGHSMGGELAAGVAVAHPDRIVGLVLIAPGGAGIGPLLSDSDELVSPAAPWVARASSYILPLHDSTWLREAASDAGYDPGTDSLAGEAARGVLKDFDFSAIGGRFRDIRQPVLLIWGRQDPTIPFETGERIAALLPCRRFVTLPALHRPHQTLPDTVTAEMDRFLRRPACDPVGAG